MKAFVEDLRLQLDKQLDLLEISNPIETSRKKVSILRDGLQALKEFILGYTFSSQQEEILFFKSYFPDLYSRLLFEKQVLIWEVHIPASQQARNGYYQLEMHRINQILDLHREFIACYRSGSTLLDVVYFCREGKLQTDELQEITLTHDSRFCTIGSIRLAKMLAYEKQMQELEKRLNWPIGTSENEDSKKITKRLKWKGPKVGLVELGYAFKEAGALDEPLREIFACFEEFFSVKLDNTPRIFQEIISRKKDEAVYLNKLAAMVKNRGDRMNENYKPKK